MNPTDPKNDPQPQDTRPQSTVAGSAFDVPAPPPAPRGDHDDLPRALTETPNDEVTHPQITSPDPDVEVEKAPKSERIPVIATAKGWYANVERNKGDRFFIDEEKDFSERWMRKAEKKEVGDNKRDFPTAQKRLDPSDLKNMPPSRGDQQEKERLEKSERSK